jgi:hypothetical protein
MRLPIPYLGYEMWYIALGIYLFISALSAILFWIILIVAKQSDNKTPLDPSESESKDSV